MPTFYIVSKNVFRGYGRIWTSTPSFRTVQPNFRLVLGIPFYQYWLYQFVYISKIIKVISFRSSGDIDSFRAFLCPPIPILPCNQYHYWNQLITIKSPSPLISATTSDNTDMQHSLLIFHLKRLRRSYVASSTAFLNLGLLYIQNILHFTIVFPFYWLNISTLSPHGQRKSKVIFHTAI